MCNDFQILTLLVKFVLDKKGRCLFVELFEDWFPTFRANAIFLKLGVSFWFCFSFFFVFLYFCWLPLSSKISISSRVKKCSSKNKKKTKKKEKSSRLWQDLNPWHPHYQTSAFTNWATRTWYCVSEVFENMY